MGFTLLATSSLGTALAFAVPVAAVMLVAYAWIGRALVARILEIHSRALEARRLAGVH